MASTCAGLCACVRTDLGLQESFLVCVSLCVCIVWKPTVQNQPVLYVIGVV